jgi:hypothetical protein
MKVLNTQEMIQALSMSGSEIVARKCQRILNQETTIEAELKWSGSFMTYVLTDNYEMALKSADYENYRTLLTASKHS